MKAYIRHLLALFATFFGSQASMTPSTYAQTPEAEAWADAKAAGTLKAMEDYLARYPVGPYSREAFREIIRLSNDVFTSPTVDDDLGDGDPALPDDAYVGAGALY